METSTLAALIEPLVVHPAVRIGFADLRGLLTHDYRQCRSGIAIMRRLDDDVMAAVVDGPTPAYLAHYRAVNEELGELAASLAARLCNHGIDAIALDPTSRDRELDERSRATLTVPVSHKMVATRAGLGWIGKTDLFVTPDWGPRVRLASVLIADQLDRAGVPIDESRCGACRVCVDACPAGAATGEPWTTATPRDVFFDAFACRASCRALARERLHEDISICGVCVARCPLGVPRPHA